MKNQLRIIGGEWKRRVLPFASIDGLRPTPDRVRETLFNWLMWDIQNAQVLDICTGSGALGFEALSRGAASVYMIEPDKTQARFLKDNIELLKAQNCHLINATAQQALPRLKEQFDVVFLDPPYSLNLWHELSNLAETHIKKMGIFTLKLTEIYLSFIFQPHGNKLKPLKLVQFTRGFTRK